MIVGISGKIGSGKDTVAAMLQELRPERSWEIKKFAGKLKQVASLLTGVPVEKFEDQEFKKTLMARGWDTVTEHHSGDVMTRMSYRMSYRDFLQKLGTEAIRDNVHKNAWVNALFAEYNGTALDPSDFWPEDGTTPRKSQNWLITDTRFPNEAQAVLDRGGKLIRVVRNTETGNHPSETALDDWGKWDFIIENNGTLDDLREKVKAISRLL